MSEMERPLVSVSVITYNHEQFIARTIESVLAQEVDFDYEIVIAEDCSTDRTREIVMEYAEKYPQIIRPLLHEHNLGMKGNADALRRACRGIYRSHIEGDDAWVDKGKLKRQVEFLQNNPDYIAIGGAFECYDENNRRTPFPWGKISDVYALEDYTLEHARKWLMPAHSSSLTYRNVFYNLDEKMMSIYESAKLLGDRKLATFLVCQGKMKYEDKLVMHRGVLRKSQNSYTDNWRKIPNQSAIAYQWFCETENMVRDWFDFELDLSQRKKVSWGNALKAFGKLPTKVNWNVLVEIYKMSDRKKEYRQYARELLMSRVHEKVRTEGKKALIKSFFTYPVKALKKAKKVNVRTAMANEKIGKKYLQDNL